MVLTLKNNAAAGYQGPMKIELWKGAGLLFIIFENTAMLQIYYKR